MFRRCMYFSRKNSAKADNWNLKVEKRRREFNPNAPDSTFHHDRAAAIRPDESMTRWISRYINDHAFEPKHADNRSFGGDGSSRSNEIKDQIQHIDKRWTNPNLPHVQDNVLKGAFGYEDSDGSLFDNARLRGRVVGLAFMTKSQKSLHLYEHLDLFQRSNMNRFVGIVVPVDNELPHMTLSKRHGLSLLTKRNGASLVMRDAGLAFAVVAQLFYPKLFIVDGTNGYIISRHGYQSVMVRPENCMSEWVDGYSKLTASDFLKCALLPKIHMGG